MSTPVPEAWIGRAVELIFLSGEQHGVHRRPARGGQRPGIVLTVEGHGEHPARPLFYP